MSSTSDNSFVPLGGAAGEPSSASSPAGTSNATGATDAASPEVKPEETLEELQRRKTDCINRIVKSQLVRANIHKRQPPSSPATSATSTVQHMLNSCSASSSSLSSASVPVAAAAAASAVKKDHGRSVGGAQPQPHSAHPPSSLSGWQMHNSNNNITKQIDMNPHESYPSKEALTASVSWPNLSSTKQHFDEVDMRHHHQHHHHQQHQQQQQHLQQQHHQQQQHQQQQHHHPHQQQQQRLYPQPEQRHYHRYRQPRDNSNSSSSNSSSSAKQLIPNWMHVQPVDTSYNLWSGSSCIPSWNGKSFQEFSDLSDIVDVTAGTAHGNGTHVVPSQVLVHNQRGVGGIECPGVEDEFEPIPNLKIVSKYGPIARTVRSKTTPATPEQVQANGNAFTQSIASNDKRSESSFMMLNNNSGGVGVDPRFCTNVKPTSQMEHPWQHFNPPNQQYHRGHAAMGGRRGASGGFDDGSRCAPAATGIGSMLMMSSGGGGARKEVEDEDLLLAMELQQIEIDIKSKLKAQDDYDACV